MVITIACLLSLLHALLEGFNTTRLAGIQGYVQGDILKHTMLVFSVKYILLFAFYPASPDQVQDSRVLFDVMIRQGRNMLSVFPVFVRQIAAAAHKT